MLPGRRTGQVWQVRSRFERKSGFSVGYLVENGRGGKAFLKATDLGMARSKKEASTEEKRRQTLRLHIYEREILTICRGNGFDRVVSCLDEGEDDGDEGLVLYLVFELAKGDGRSAALAAESGQYR
jgi:hypothetical protein